MKVKRKKVKLPPVLRAIEQEWKSARSVRDHPKADELCKLLHDGLVEHGFLEEALKLRVYYHVIPGRIELRYGLLTEWGAVTRGLETLGCSLRMSYVTNNPQLLNDLPITVVVKEVMEREVCRFQVKLVGGHWEEV